jgi:hypothetical protein
MLKSVVVNSVIVSSVVVSCVIRSVIVSGADHRKLQAAAKTKEEGYEG